jgi:putative glutamine amidotransferase
MIRIGLTYTGTEWKHENYVRWLCDGGAGAWTGPIEVVRLAAADANLEELTHCDALVLSGGVDIHPGLYGGAFDYAKTPAGGWEQGRDLFEQAALELAWQRKMPVLGVCRGLQLINVSLKGNLLQDLGVSGDALHENTTGTDPRHGVSIVAETLLAAVTGHAAGTVNSAHHQAIDRLGEGLRVNCRATDQTIEGIEWAEPAGKPFLLAVQWHPERMYVNALADGYLYRAIRERLIDEIRKNKQLQYADH